MEKMEIEWKQEQEQRQGDVSRHVRSRNGWSFGAAGAHWLWDRQGAGAQGNDDVG